MIALVALLALVAPAETVTLTSQPSWARVYQKKPAGKKPDAWVRVGRTPLKLEVDAPVEVELRYRGMASEALSLAPGQARAHVCFDPPGQLLECERLLRTGLRPKSVAFRPGTDELWVALFAGPPSLQVFDLKTGKKTHSIRIGRDGAIEMAFSEDGKRLFTSQLEKGLVVEVDAVTKEVVRKISVLGKWPKIVTLSPDEKTLYSSNWRSHDVSEIDLATGKVNRRFKTTKVPRGMHVLGGKLFVAGYYRGHLDVVDLKTGEATTVYKDGDSLRHIVGRGGTVLVSDMGTYEVLKVDPKSYAVERLVKTDPNPNTIALSPDGALLFVSSRGRNAGPKGKAWLKPGPTWGSLVVYDVETGKKLDGVVTGNQTTGLAVSPDGLRVAVTDFLDNRVRVHRVPDLKTLRAGPGRVRQYRRELKKPDEAEE